MSKTIRKVYTGAGKKPKIIVRKSKRNATHVKLAMFKLK